MTQPEDTPGAPPETAAAPELPRSRPGERLAKAIARAGLGSRREAEAWIGEGRVAINGATVESAAVNVLPGDRIEVDGRPLPARERTRLWLYHKPRGYVTTTHDPEGRETVFSILPPELPRVMTIGRLDINTEGLLLLTNDGGLARMLELPETGWLRRYRVRAFGRANPDALAALKDGLTIDGFAYGAIEAEIERQQNDNAWLRLGLREGKNREVKRVAEHLGLSVNRLIRISFGPFQLGSLPEGGVEEVRTRTLVEQLGRRLIEEADCDFEAPVVDLGAGAPRKTGGRGGSGGAAPQTAARAAPERSRMTDPSQRVGRRAPVVRPRDMPAPASAEGAAPVPTRTKRAAPVADRRGRTVKVERVARADPEAAPKRVRKRDEGAAERFGAVGRPPRPPRAGAKPGARDARPPRGDGERRGPPRGAEASGRGDRPAARPDGDRPARRPSGDRPVRAPSGDRPARPPSGDRPARAPYGDRPAPKAYGDRPARAPSGDRPARAPYAERPSRDRPAAAGPGRTVSAKPRTSAPRWRDDAPGGEAKAAASRAPRDGARPQRARPEGGRPQGDRPARPRPDGDGPRSDRPGPDKPRPDKPRPDKPRPDKPRPGGAKSDRPRGDRPQSDRPKRDAPRTERPREDRPARAGGGRTDRPGDGGRPPSGAGRPPREDRPAGNRPSGAAGRISGGRPGGPAGGKPRGPGGGGKPRPSGGGGVKPRGPGGGGQGSGRGRPAGADRRR